MDIELSDTIQDIDEEEWESLVGTDHVERSHKWYKTVEDSRMRNMHYVFVKENGELKAAACCFLFEKIVYRINVPFLYVRSPLGTSLAFFSKTAEHATLLLTGLNQIRKKEKAKGFLILDLKKEEFTSVKKQVKGFAGFPKMENTYIDLNFSDFEDYLSFLDAKARRSVRITLNKANRLNIKSCITNEFSQWAKVVHNLHTYTCEQHNEYRWHITEQFCTALEENFSQKGELALFFKDETPLAFGLSLNTPEVCLYKFAGTDPKYREYHAYFLIYYEGIKRALEKKQKRIYFGPTTYEFKEKIGCKREELYGLVKIDTLTILLKPYVKTYELLGKKF